MGTVLEGTKKRAESQEITDMGSEPPTNHTNSERSSCTSAAILLNHCFSYRTHTSGLFSSPISTNLGRLVVFRDEPGDARGRPRLCRTGSQAKGDGAAIERPLTLGAFEAASSIRTAIAVIIAGLRDSSHRSRTHSLLWNEGIDLLARKDVGELIAGP